MPVPEWMNRLEMEENFQYPSPEEYEPSLQETFVSSVNDVSFGHEDAVNLRSCRSPCPGNCLAFACF